MCLFSRFRCCAFCCCSLHSFELLCASICHTTWTNSPPCGSRTAAAAKRRSDVNNRVIAAISLRYGKDDFLKENEKSNSETKKYTRKLYMDYTRRMQIKMSQQMLTGAVRLRRNNKRQRSCEYLGSDVEMRSFRRNSSVIAIAIDCIQTKCFAHFGFSFFRRMIDRRCRRASRAMSRRGSSRRGRTATAWAPITRCKSTF